MISTDDVQQILGLGGSVTDSSGDKIGKIGQVFLDDQTGQPEWVTVKTGLFGSGESFVPLSAGSISGEDIHVPYDKDKVKDAPRVDDSDGHLSPDQETELYRYYGLETSGTETYVADTSETYVADTSETDVSDTSNQGVVGNDTSGPETDSAMTRSEEQLHVGTEKVTTGRARLRKYIVTENVTKTVPVSHEEVRLVTEPITEANRGDALAGGDLTSEEHEVTLSEEQIVTSKETVPVERVRLDTETVTEERQVNEEVAKEQIEYDDSGLTDGTPAHRAD